jgi:hypothetical protein
VFSIGARCGPAKRHSEPDATAKSQFHTRGDPTRTGTIHTYDAKEIGAGARPTVVSTYSDTTAKVWLPIIDMIWVQGETAI